MTNIVNAVTRVTDIMGEIASASDEQSRGIDQVAQAVSEMDRVTQQNASLVQESAAAAAALEEQASRLTQAVSAFRLAASPQSQNHRFNPGQPVKNHQHNHAGISLNKLQTGKHFDGYLLKHHCCQIDQMMQQNVARIVSDGAIYKWLYDTIGAVTGCASGFLK